MLQYMRDKAASWIVIIFLGLIIFVFIFMGFGGGFDKAANHVAVVNDSKIYQTEVQQQYKNTVEQIRRYNKNFVITEAFEKRLVTQAREQLIQEKLIMQEAAKLGIDAKADTINYNYTNKAFMKNGKFDVNEYKKVLELQGLNAADYESRMSKYLLQDKMRSLVVNSVKISEDEIVNRFVWDETTVSADYVLFNPSNYENAKYSDKDLSEYLMKNSNKYRTDPKVKVQYVEINPNDYSKDSKVSESDIKEYYKSNPEQFLTPKTVVVRHILIRTEKDSSAKEIETAKNKAFDVYKKAKKGENFIKLAKKYSEGPTKKSGGFLGEFKKGGILKEIDEKIFSMKSGEISEPVKTVYGWHVIKLDKINEKKIKSYELAESSIKAKLLKNKIESKAYEIGDAIFEAVDNDDSLKDFAKSMKVKFAETKYFTKTDLNIDPKVKKVFVETAFKLFDGEICEPKVINGYFYLIKKVGKKDSEIAKLSVVKKQVINDYLSFRRDQDALKDAEKFQSSLKDETSFSKSSKDFKKIVKVVRNVKRSQIIPNIGQNPTISKALFSLKKDKIYTGVLSDVNGYFVFKLNKRTKPAIKGLASKRVGIVQALSYEKKNDAFSGWVADIRKNSVIEITK